MTLDEGDGSQYETTLSNEQLRNEYTLSYLCEPSRPYWIDYIEVLLNIFPGGDSLSAMLLPPKRHSKRRRRLTRSSLRRLISLLYDAMIISTPPPTDYRIRKKIKMVGTKYNSTRKSVRHKRRQSQNVASFSDIHELDISVDNMFSEDDSDYDDESEDEGNENKEADNRDKIDKMERELAFLRCQVSALLETSKEDVDDVLSPPTTPTKDRVESTQSDKLSTNIEKKDVIDPLPPKSDQELAALTNLSTLLNKMNTGTPS